MSQRPSALLAALALVASLTTVAVGAGGAGPAAAADSAVVAVADGYVDQTQSRKSFGGALELRVASAPAQQRSYVRFDVPPTSGGIARAVLRLRPIAPGSDVAVANVPDATWSEKQLTWARAPDVGAVLGRTAVDSTGWAQLDVTETVAAAGSRVAFALLPAPGSASFASREVAASAPRLVITAAGASPTPTPSATATPTPSVPAVTDSPYGDEVLADAPTAYWRLDETAGTTATSATGAHHGGYVGSPTLGAVPGVAADGGSSVSLDGKDDTIRVPHTAALSVSGGLTLETWVNPRSLPSTSTLIRKDLQYLLRVAGNGSITFRIWKNGVGQDLTSASGVIKTSTWTHVVATWDGAATRLYADGVLLTTGSLSGPAGTSTNVLELGSGNGYDFLPGSQDDTAVYPHALSSSRVGAHWTTSGASSHASPVLLMAPVAGSTSEARPNIGGRAGTAPGDAGTVQADVWAGSSTAGAPAFTVDAAVQKAGTFSARTPMPLSSGTWTVRVRQASTSGAVGRSSSSTFLVDAEAPPRLLLAGDIAGCDTYGDEATALLLDRLPGTVATVGDHAYQDGTQDQFEDCYDPTWGRHRSRTRPTVGGHEYKTPAAAPYYAYFGSAAGDPAKGYYSYELGSWHVVSLNDSCSDVGGCEAGSPQEQWLRADLAASTASCTVAILHTPRFSSGKIHGSNPVMQPLWQALYDHGADVVVSAHDHFYERLAPLTPTGALDRDRGIRQFVAGMGGRSLYAFGTLNAHSEARDNTAYGVLSMTLREGGYDWELVPEEGKTYRDAGSASCH